jgi:hypothetical protein
MQASKIRFSFCISIEHGFDAHLNCRGAVMAWEDEELNEYESKRARFQQQSKLSSQRLQLVEDQHNQRWMMLRTEISAAFLNLNAKAAREITRSTDVRANHLVIAREDGEKLEAHYDPNTKTVTISSDAVPFAERKYELTVRTIDGNDTVAWWNGKDIETAESLAKAVFSGFLRAGMT